MHGNLLFIEPTHNYTKSMGALWCDGQAHMLDSSVMSVRLDLNYSICHPETDGWETLRRLQQSDLRMYR